MSRRHVIMCQPRFVPLILDGRKTQTIRPIRKRPIWPGDILDLRQWAGLPYRSKQAKICEKVCSDYDPFCIFWGFRIVINGSEIGVLENYNFLARKDGFVDIKDMKEWFNKTHKLPFQGTIIYWKEP